MATGDFLNYLQEIGGVKDVGQTALPTEANGIYHDLTIKTTEDDGITPRLGEGVYGSIKEMYISIGDSAQDAADAQAAAAATAADVVLTHADVVTTNADAVTTTANKDQTALDVISTTADALIASNSATAAALSEAAAEAAQLAAELAQAATELIFDTFDDRFLGTKDADPTLDNDGNPLGTGSVYYNSVDSEIKFYNGATWDAPDSSATASAQAANTSAIAAALSAASVVQSEANALASAAAAVLSETNAGNSAVSSAADVITVNNAIITTNADVVLTNADAASTAQDSIDTNADKLATNADVISTAADVVTTNSDVLSTAAAVTATGLDVVTTNADVVLTAADAAQTALDRVQTVANAAQTTLDVIATNGDASTAAQAAIDTAADLVATNQDSIDTAADALATGNDVIATNADVVITNGDVVLTNADAVTTGNNATTATTQAGIATTKAGEASDSEIAAAASALAAQVAEIDWQGDWLAGEYQARQAVGYLGSSYIANKITSEVPGVLATDWDVIALRGEDGDLFSGNNLSDLSDIPTARTNLDVYSKAESDSISSTMSDADVKIAYENNADTNALTDVRAGIVDDALVSTNNLSDVADVNTAKNNLGITTTAIPEGDFMMGKPILFLASDGTYMPPQPVGYAYIEFTADSTTITTTGLTTTDVLNWDEVLAVTPIIGGWVSCVVSPSWDESYGIVTGANGTELLVDWNVGYTLGLQAEAAISYQRLIFLEADSSVNEGDFTFLTNAGMYVGLTPLTVGLGNVDNTTDLNKPISTATQTALDGKIDDGQVLTNVPAGALFTDTVYDDTTTTKQGNTFNGSTQLVQTDATGKLPAIDGSQLTGVSTVSALIDLSDTTITTPTDGQSLNYDTISGKWVNVDTVNGTSKRQSFVATTSQTVFVVTGGYEAGYADVYLNGSKLLNGDDVTVTSGTEVVLTVGATAGDIIDVVAYGVFVLADHYTKAEDDNMLALKAPLASPALTGVPTAPTATTGTNNTQLATTAFVNAEIAGASATVDGVTGTIGLVRITDTNTGYRLDRDVLANKGVLGVEAVDLSLGGGASTTRGATGSYSTAMGSYTTASNAYSTAAGYYTTAAGWCSTAIGYFTTASVTGSTAMGGYTIASGDYSTSMGDNTIASGISSVSMGRYSQTSQDGCLGLGYQTDSTGYSSAIKADQNLRILLNGVTGDGYFDGTADLGNADYAEYFEWVDGNPNNEDRRGLTVSLVGEKIKIAEENEVIIGVISATPAIVGDSASLRWANKYELDEFGAKIMIPYTMTEWTETIGEGENLTEHTREEKHSYHSDFIPEDLVVPSDATVRSTDSNGKPLMEAKLNPNWDAASEYIPRSERKEWSPVGLLGKLYTRKDQVVSSNWIKLSDVNENIVRYLVR